eukprot:10160000-Alexandrium_andersonii.AAC.1
MRDSAEGLPAVRHSPSVTRGSATAVHGRTAVSESQPGVWWMRLFGMVRRGSKVYLHILPE